MHQLLTIVLYHINVYSLSGLKTHAERSADKKAEEYFLALPQKSLLREKEKLHLGEIDSSSDQSKMDDTSDPLNLLEQKVIRLLSEHSPTTAEGTRTACCGHTDCTC